MHLLTLILDILVKLNGFATRAIRFEHTSAVFVCAAGNLRKTVINLSYKKCGALRTNYRGIRDAAVIQLQSVIGMRSILPDKCPEHRLPVHGRVGHGDFLDYVIALCQTCHNCSLGAVA